MLKIEIGHNILPMIYFMINSSYGSIQDDILLYRCSVISCHYPVTVITTDKCPYYCGRIYLVIYPYPYIMNLSYCITISETGVSNYISRFRQLGKGITCRNSVVIGESIITK